MESTPAATFGRRRTLGVAWELLDFRAMEGQVRELRRGMRRSVAIGVVALSIAVAAYALEKGFYASLTLWAP